MARAAYPVPVITRVRVTDFRSIADCDVTLGPLTVLLGFNASGKSNFLDALRFVVDAVTTSPQQAVSDRGGLDELLRRGPEPVDSFRIQLDFVLRPEGGTTPDAEVPATYAVEIGRDPDGVLACAVLDEECAINHPDGQHAFRAMDEGFTAAESNRFRIPGSRSAVMSRPEARDSPFETSGEGLYLPVATALDGRFAAVDVVLRSTKFHELTAEVLRTIDTETTRQFQLGSSGQHLGHVLGALKRDHPEVKERLDAYLSSLVANAVGIDEQPEGRYSTVAARFVVGGTPYVDPQTEVFHSEALSEGTLLAAGVLAALFQPAALDGRISLLAIEEPEKALHPAAVGTLYEALTDAAERVQVIATSQSSELLDSEEADLSHIRVAANVDGVTYIGPVDGHGHDLVARKLMSISELHRSGQMRPEQVGYPADRQR